MRKTWKLLTFAALLCLSLGIAACNGGSVGSADPVEDPAENVVIVLEAGTPSADLGKTGDVCLVAETGAFYRKTESGWEQTTYERYDADGSTLTVTYSDGSTGTYAMAASEETDCPHTLGELVTIYEPLCVVPGIGVRTCTLCHESFPEILPAAGHHTFEEGNGYACKVCNENHITTPKSLLEFETDVVEGEDFTDETIYLDVDIDLSEIEGWKPITKFHGIFEGQGHTITNPGTVAASIDLETPIVDESGVFAEDIAPENIRDLHVEIAVGDIGFTHQFEYGPQGGVIAEDYKVKSAEGLRAFRDLVNSNVAGTTFAGKTVNLTQDIDLKYELFYRIGIRGTNTCFAGTFNSNGYEIQNVKVATKADELTAAAMEIGEVFNTFTGGGTTSVTTAVDNCLSKDAVLNYTVHNYGDLEQIYTWKDYKNGSATKDNNYAIGGERTWIVNNAAGMKLFRDRVNNLNHGASNWQYRSYAYDTVKLADDIDLNNEPFVVIGTTFTGVFDSQGHTFTNVVTGNVLNGETIRSQEFGQIFADYGNLGNAAVFDYTLHNEGDFEQASHYWKEAGELMHADHQWYIHNAEGLRRFSDITNSHPKWNAADRGDVPITFSFAPTPIPDGDVRINHTIHLTCDIDLKNEPFVRVGSGFQGIFDSGDYVIKNVFVANSATDLRQVQEWGQVFAYNTKANSDIHYTVRNGSDFEQVSTFSKNRGETIYHDVHDWYIHNADGLRRFSDITNSHPNWDVADRGDVPITFDFAPTVKNGDTRVNHTIHLTCDIDLENKPFVRVGSGFQGIFDSGDYVIKNVCPTYSATDLRQGQEWGQVFANNTFANSDIHYTVRNGSDFEQVSTFSKTRGETAMYAQQDWYIRNEAGFARFAAINGSAYAYNTEGRGDNPIYFDFKTTYSNVNGARVITDSHTVHLMKDLTIGNFDYPNHYLDKNNKDFHRNFGGLFDGGNHTITFTGLARAGIETGRLIPEGNLLKYEIQADKSYLSVAKIINLKMSYADSELVAKLGGYTAVYNEEGEYDKPIWRIDSVERLTAFRDLVSGGRDFKSENLLLVNDLDLKDAGWNPIGSNTNPFRGNFDGNHKTVSHFKVSGSNYLGFFGKLDSATVFDLTLANAEITGTDHVGGLAGASSSTTITGVVIDSSTIKGSSGYAGGLVGEGFTGTITDCTVKGSDVTGGEYMGGLFGQGYATPKSCIVEDCTITGTSWKAGGMVGQFNEGTRTFEDLIVRRTTLICPSGSMGMIIGFRNGSSGGVTFNRCQVINCTMISSSGNLTGAGGFIGQYYNAGTRTAVFNDCVIDGLNIEVKNGGISGVGGFIGCGYWRGYTGLTVTFNNCSVRMGTVTIADGKTIASFGAFIGDSGVNTVEYVGENVYSGCESAIGTSSGTVTGEPKKRD